MKQVATAISNCNFHHILIQKYYNYLFQFILIGNRVFLVRKYWNKQQSIYTFLLYRYLFKIVMTQEITFFQKIGNSTVNIHHLIYIIGSNKSYWIYLSIISTTFIVLGLIFLCQGVSFSIHPVLVELYQYPSKFLLITEICFSL